MRLPSFTPQAGSLRLAAVSISLRCGIVLARSARWNCREGQSYGRKGQMTITRAINEIGIVLYRGVQAACVHGLTDLFGIAAALASNQHPDGRSALPVTPCEAARRATF